MRLIDMEDGGFINPEHVVSLRDKFLDRDFELDFEEHNAWRLAVFDNQGNEDYLEYLDASTPAYMREKPVRDSPKYHVALIKMVDGEEFTVAAPVPSVKWVLENGSRMSMTKSLHV